MEGVPNRGRHVVVTFKSAPWCDQRFWSRKWTLWPWLTASIHQWPVCDLPSKSARGVKIHRTKAHGKNDKTVQNTQNFKGRLADRAVVESKLVDQQSSRPNVLCEGEPLENVFRFPYLGAIFAADGLQGYDIRARIGKAMTRCGKLGHMFDSPDLDSRLKIRLYNVTVVSIVDVWVWVLEPHKGRVEEVERSDACQNHRS